MESSFVNQSDNIRNSNNSLSDDLESLKKNVDIFFLVVTGSIVFFLKAGFAFYESGSVRRKNVTSVLFQNYLDTSVGCLFYLLSGYALAFGDGNGFCGARYFALVGLPIDKMAHCFFQYTFAATAATIVSGSLHERCSTIAFFSYTILVSGFTYPIVSHWAWSPFGWLFQLGYVDFAGSAVVHATGGSAALAATLMVGPRLGRFEKNGDFNPTQPHSIPQITLGSFISIFGVIAFNAGSNLTISRPNDGVVISKIVVNTLICVSSATMTGLFYQRFFTAAGRSLKNWNFISMLNGSFAGMIVICAGCDRYPPWGSLVVGILSYFSFLLVLKAMRRFQIDDTTNTVPVQLGPGYLGVICGAIFTKDGVILNPSKSSALGLLMNIIGGAVIIVWSFSTTLILYVILRYLDVHRATPRQEKLGLDLAIHNQAAYNMDEDIERIDSVESMGNRSTAKVQPSSVPFGLRRMVSEPHIHAW